MLFPQKNILVCGRGATAIFLVLQHLKKKDNRRKVIVPVNICYAAIYPLVYAGYSPVFCDVCSADGNVSLECIKKKMDSEIAGMLIPHMYGNPVQEIAKIGVYCHSNNLFLIEDCASAMGASLSDGRKVGTFGDYSIYSTGYAKTVDLGIGGVITSNNDLLNLIEMEKKLPYYKDSIDNGEHVFSSQYRQYRNSNQKLKGSKWESYLLRRSHRSLFLFRISMKTKRLIFEKIEERLSFEINRRRENNELYSRYLQKASLLIPYQFHSGAVPWRFSVYVPPEKRRRIIDLLLDAKQPVSDWYPPVAQLFNDSDYYPGAEISGSSILNFPLSLSRKEIAQLCCTFLKIIRKVS